MSETRMREALEKIVVQTMRMDAYEATKVMIINEIALAALTESSPSKERAHVSPEIRALAEFAVEAAQRLREMEGERIEGFVNRERATWIQETASLSRSVSHLDFTTRNTAYKGIEGDVPAILIVKEPKS